MEAWASAHEMRYALANRAGRLVRAWRVLSPTAISGVLEATPDLVGGDPVVIIEATAGSGLDFKWAYVVLRLAPGGGTRARFSLSHAAWGDVITSIRVGPDGKLYQLGSSPTVGVVINRFSLGPVPQPGPVIAPGLPFPRPGGEDGNANAQRASPAPGYAMSQI